MHYRALTECNFRHNTEWCSSDFKWVSTKQTESKINYKFTEIYANVPLKMASATGNRQSTLQCFKHNWNFCFHLFYIFHLIDFIVDVVRIIWNCILCIQNELWTLWFLNCGFLSLFLFSVLKEAHRTKNELIWSMRQSSKFILSHTWHSQCWWVYLI